MTATSYTLRVRDLGARLRGLNPDGTIIVLPTTATAAIPVNTELEFWVAPGGGPLRVDVEPGVTVNGPPGSAFTVYEGVGARVVKVADAEWDWEQLAGNPTSIDVATTSEAISGPAAAELYNSSGAKVRKADATGLTKPCNCLVVDAVGSGASVTIYMPGQWVPWAGGLTPATHYCLSTTPGAIVPIGSAPSAAGNGYQVLGVANAAGTHLFFNPEPMTGA